MIEGLSKLLGYDISGRPPQEDINKLYQAFFGAYNLNNTVSWLENRTQTFIDEGYRGNAAIYSIVNKIMMKDSEPVLQAFKAKSNKKSKYNKATKYKGTELSIAESRVYLKKDLVLVETGVLSDLLSKPNQSQTQYSFIQDLSMYWRLTGEFFIYGVKIGIGRDANKFSEMFVLPSHLVDIIQGDMFQPVKGYKFRIGDQTVILDPDEVLHVKTANPNWTLQGSQLRGQSALLAGLKYLQKNTEAIGSLYRAVLNEGAKGFMSPYPVSDPNVWFTPDQLISLKDQVRSGIEGMMNRNKVSAMGVPMNYTDIAKSPTDLDTLKAMDADFKTFCNLWGVNPAIFSDDPKYDNMNSAMKSLVTDVSMPFLKQLEQGLSDWLIPRYTGEVDYLEFDTTVYAELQPDIKLILETYGKHPAFTWNELRIMLGWDEIEGELGNTHWLQGNYIPAQDALMGAADFQDFPTN
jgi:HK97 family phage portal protein